jgi:peptidoglycan/xylan/chitin deacetylase (PgdA/CDA1 family)
MSPLIDYFVYPHRRPGLDHERFAHRYLADAAPIAWPDSARLALWVTVPVEHFPMDMPTKPFIPLGGMDRIYPSVWDYTMRDYGNRVGIFRLMKCFDRHGIRPTAFMNSDVAKRYPVLIDEVLRRDWEIAASGVNMGKLHYGGLPLEQERAQVEEAVTTLRKATGRPVLGWHSPAFSQSAQTPELAAAAGIQYLGDWINDDMPYAMRTANGGLTAMPHSYELSDRKILFLDNQALEDYEAQILAAFDCLYREAKEKGGRILSLTVSSWVLGQAHRIAALDRILGQILAHAGVWRATGAEIMTAWRKQAGGV